MNITVIHTLAPEIIALLQGFTNNQNGGSTLPAATGKVKTLAPVKTDVKNETSTDTATSNDDATIEQVRAAVQAKAQGGKRDQVKALLSEYDVAKVTELDKSKYAEFLTKVNAL